MSSGTSRQSSGTSRQSSGPPGHVVRNFPTVIRNFPTVVWTSRTCRPGLPDSRPGLPDSRPELPDSRPDRPDMSSGPSGPSRALAGRLSCSDSSRDPPPPEAARTLRVLTLSPGLSPRAPFRIRRFQPRRNTTANREGGQHNGQTLRPRTPLLRSPLAARLLGTRLGRHDPRIWGPVISCFSRADVPGPRPSEDGGYSPKRAQASIYLE